MTDGTRRLSKRVDALVRHVMRNLAHDRPDKSGPVDEVPDFFTHAEADEAGTEIARRVRAAILETQSRIVARLPHLTDADLAALDRLIQETIAPLEKRYRLH